MPIDHRKVIDKLSTVKTKTADIKKQAGSLEPSEEQVLGLRFKPGDSVTIKETGEVVKVARGTRTSYELQTARKEGS